jgi:hypothetical protein
MSHNRTPEQLDADIKAAQDKIIPILRQHKVDLAAQPFIDADGTIKARPVWVPLKEDGKETNNQAV